MAEKTSPNSPKELIEAIPEEIEKLEKDKDVKEELDELERFSELPEETREERRDRIEKEKIQSWAPKTKLGMSVKSGKEKDIDKILKSGRKVLEPEIIDSLLSLKTDLLLIGQAKGKFGGGKRRAWRQTQKKTKEGNVLTFSSMAVVGDSNGHVGVGYGTAKETLPAREKALRQAKLNIIKVVRGFEAVEEGAHFPHTIPFKVEGKCGSVKVILLPAPRGTGLVVGDECKKILKLVGIEDVYGITRGNTRTTFNLAKACIEALKKTNLKFRVSGVKI